MEPLTANQSGSGRRCRDAAAEGVGLEGGRRRRGLLLSFSPGHSHAQSLPAQAVSVAEHHQCRLQLPVLHRVLVLDLQEGGGWQSRDGFDWQAFFSVTVPWAFQPQRLLSGWETLPSTLRVVVSRPEVPLAQASSKAERQLTSVLFPQPAASVASFQKPPASSLAAQQAASPAGHVWLHAKRLLQPVASVRDIAE